MTFRIVLEVQEWTSEKTQQVILRPNHGSVSLQITSPLTVSCILS